MTTKKKNLPGKAPRAPQTAQNASPPGKGPDNSFRALFDKYRVIAAQIPEQSVLPCRADVRVALVNIKLGIKGVCGTEEQIALVRKHLPEIPIDDVLELPDIGRALVFSNSKVITRAASPREIEKALQKISAPREQMLTQAEILAERGKLDKERIAKIRRGTGKYDMADDGVAIAAEYTDNAKTLKGLHPFTLDEIEALRQTSEWLLDHLTPAGGRTEPRKKTPAEDDRDRLWTLTALRHPYVRKIGYYFHGDAFEQVTPKLLSRVQEALLEEQSVEETPEPEATPPK